MSLQSSSPSGATLDALGCYILVSLSFVLVTMLEFALVLFIGTKIDNKDIVSMLEPCDRTEKDRNCVAPSQIVGKKGTWFDQSSLKDISTDRIDYISLWISMVSYLTFNVAYFIYYLHHK